MSTPTPTCVRCSREVIQQRVWAKATPELRSLWLAARKNVLQARGLCRACYLAAYRAGEITHIRPGVGGRGRKKSPARRPHPCGRCGITTRDELCRDCREVEA